MDKINLYLGNTWETIKKIWSQIDRRSLTIIVVMGLIALGYVFPKTDPNIAQNIQAVNQTSNQSISLLRQQIEALKTDLNSKDSRIRSLETKPDRNNEINTALETISDYQSQIQILKNSIIEMGKRVSYLEAGDDNDQLYLDDIYNRLDILEMQISSINTTQPIPQSASMITWTFNTNCSWHPVYSATSYGQQFSIGTYNLGVSNVSLYLKRVGVAPQVVISIYKTGTNGLPSGTPIWTTSTDTTNWSGVGQWCNFVATDLVLLANSIYCVSVSCPQGNSGQYIAFGYNNPGGYSGGALVGTLNNGSTWTLSTGPDMGFVISGVLQ